MALKQKQVIEYMGIGFKVWVLCLLAGVMVAIVMYPILMVLGFALGPIVAIMSIIIMLPLIFLATGWVFTKFYNK